MNKVKHIYYFNNIIFIKWLTYSMAYLFNGLLIQWLPLNDQ